ncbi:MAG: FIST N-terminal domain-containing protein [Alphaproteobacteria bacterium]
MKFKAAHAKAEGWAGVSKACVDQLGTLDGDFNLGFLYVTDGLAPDLSSILTFVRETTQIEDWVGAAGYGVFGGGQEYTDVPAMAILVAAMPSEDFRVFEANDGFDEFRVDHSHWIERAAPPCAIVHGDSRNGDIGGIIAGMAEESSAFLIGGLASMEASESLIAGKVTGGGLSGVMLSSRVPVATGLTQGCVPIGPVHSITDVRNNVLISLDERKALDVLVEDLGPGRDIRTIGGLVHVALPISGSDTGDYLVRNLTGIDVERGLVAIGEIPRPGDQVMFCARDRESARKDMGRMLKDLHARAGATPKGGIYFSCVARGPHLFGIDGVELGMIRDALGDFPLVGVFANGEISHDRLYSYTGVLALFL